MKILQKKGALLLRAEELNGGTLAYLGDALIEVYARERAIESGAGDVGRLNELSRQYVTAVAQSKALDNILPLLTEEEEAAYRRGRNSGAGYVPKSATRGEYARATGFEALIGFLGAKGQNDRIRFLLDAAYKTDGGSV